MSNNFLNDVLILNDLGEQEAILLTINFNFRLTEENVPNENNPFFTAGLGYQLCFGLTGYIYYRIFNIHKQKYLQWKKITSATI